LKALPTTQSAAAEALLEWSFAALHRGWKAAQDRREGRLRDRSSSCGRHAASPPAFPVAFGMDMNLPEPCGLIESLVRADARLVLVSTGGGSAAIPHLLTTPGASRVVLEAVVPYAREAVAGLLGGPQESFCSARTARRLAMVAWQRARCLGASAEQAVGAAVTASLKTSAPKRGPHRIVVAVQTLAETSVATLELHKDARSRRDEERLAAAMLLERILETIIAGRDGSGPPAGTVRSEGSAGLLETERVDLERCAAPPPWRQLLSGETDAVSAAGGAGRPAAGRLVFPGSFDPLHDGHRSMARVAEEIAEQPVEHELSITNVDKPTLDYVEMRDRAGQFAGGTLWLTRAATFVEKLGIFPDGTFVMGADTYLRLADPRYYGGSAEAAARAVREIAGRVRGLIVFGRVRDGVFQDPAQLDVPQPLRDVSFFVSQREFRVDTSSTELRQRAAERTVD
jgi:nicotinamide mononucleotide (NMN) deamidase PncC